MDQDEATSAIFDRVRGGGSLRYFFKKQLLSARQEAEAHPNEGEFRKAAQAITDELQWRTEHPVKQVFWIVVAVLFARWLN